MKTLHSYTYNLFKKYPVVLVLIIAGIMVRFCFVAFLPFGQTIRFHIEGLNDEPSHFNYVKYLTEMKRFPVQTESTQSPDAFKNNVFEYYQPPLYYLLCASVSPLLKDKGTLYFGRFLSFLAGLLSLIVLYKIFTHLNLPERLKIVALVFYVFHLPNVYFCSVLSNDSLSWLIALLISFYLIVVYSKAGKTPVKKRWVESLMLAFLLGAGMLTKSSIFVFFPVLVYIYLISYFKYSKYSLLLECMAILFIASIIAFPWYLRNWIVYHSVFALHIGFGPASDNLNTLMDWRYILTSTISKFWFPMQNLQRTIYYKMFSCISVGIVFLHIAALAGYVIRGKRVKQKSLILLAILLLSLSAYVKLLSSWNNPEARYFFQSWASILYFWFIPLVTIIHRWNVLLTIVLLETSIGYLYFLFT